MKSKFLPLLSILPIFLVLLLVTPSASQTPTKSIRVGQFITDQINLQIGNQKIYPLQVGAISKKYLFIRLRTSIVNQAVIGLYSNVTGELIFSCLNDTYDACYLPSSMLTENHEYGILIMSNTPVTYQLMTNWGDLEHVKPNENIRFIFDNNDQTQLFHLDLNKDVGQFKQIRITLKPETVRSEGDSLKIFANKGLTKQPTQLQHDYRSIHIWNDVQGIILSSEQLKNQQGVSFFIVGNAKTVYILSTEMIKKDHHDININENIYEYANPHEENLYHMNFLSETGNATSDLYVVRFSVFTGEVDVGFYRDKELKDLFREVNYQYMNDIQFHIKREELNKEKMDLYMVVRARDVSSTFQINFQGRKNIHSFEIYENIYEFMPLTKDPKSFHFYSHLWAQSQIQILQTKSQKFDLSVINVESESVIQFYKCQSLENEQICQERGHPDFTKYATKINPTGKSIVGSKIIYNLEIMNQDLEQTVDGLEKKALIVVLASAVNEKPSFIALELHNSNKIRFLREDRAFEDKVRRGETRVYKYQNVNPNILQIKIHINKISGLTQIQAHRSENSQQKSLDTNPSQPNTFLIDKNITEPIIIKIKGVVTSIFTITVITTHKDHPLSSSLTLNEDIEYQLKIMPFTYINIQIHPIEEIVVFQYNSVGGSIVVCEVDRDDLCKNGTVLAGNQEKLKINSQNARQIKIRLANIVNINMTNKLQPIKNSSAIPSQLIRPVKVKVIYHSLNKWHCESRSINKVYSEKAKVGSCFNFHLPLASNIQIMAIEDNIATGVVKFYICSQPVQPEISDARFLIRDSVISASCKEFPDDMNLTMVLVDVTHKGEKDVEIKIDYSIQYAQDIITLADGIAYFTRTKSLESGIKTFFYEIMDESSNLQIILHNKKGNQLFLAKIVRFADRYKTSLTEEEAPINSKESNYYANPTIEVTSRDIQKAQCGQNCVIVMTVFSGEKPGNQIQFGIQVNEHEIVLTQGESRKDFLPKGSTHYYSYESKRNQIDLLFKISDNNRKCTISYLSNHPYPSPSNYIAFENQQTLIYKNAKKQRYYYAVEATEDCPFSLIVTEGNTKLQKLEFGHSFDIKLAQGEQIWFYFNHLSKSSFKIYSLLKHGLIDISANETEITHEMLSEIENGKIKTDQFMFRSSEFSSLFIKESQKGFCSSCSYLMSVKARKITEGSLTLALEASKISLEAEKTLFDELITEKSASYLSFYKVSNGSIVLKAIEGKIMVEMTYDNQKFEKTYEKSTRSYNDYYTFNKRQNLFTPIQIKVTALSSPALYSFQIYPTLQKFLTNIQKLNPGISEYLTLKSEEKCFKGTLNSKQEELYLSSDLGDNIEFSELEITSMLDDKNVQTINQEFGKILSLKFNITQKFFPTARNYLVCIKPKTQVVFPVTLSITQNQKMNLISPDTAIFVRGQGLYAIHENGPIILDLLQCSGKAEVSESTSLQDLDSKLMKNLDIVGIHGQNHAIRMDVEKVLFLKVKVGFGQLLWMPLNEEKEKGIGYYKYTNGKLSYTTAFNTIQFQIGGIYKTKQTKTKVQSIKYMLHISNSRQSLQSAVQCQMNHIQNVIQVPISSSEIGESSSPMITVKVDKKRISETFPTDETIYFNVVADLTLTAPNEEKQHEHYRFVYAEQIVLAELLRQNQIQAKINFDIYIPIIVTSCIGAILVIYAIVKWLIPALGRCRGRVLVEENNDEHKEVEMEAPPSSERKQMETGTTERMG